MLSSATAAVWRCERSGRSRCSACTARTAPCSDGGVEVAAEQREEPDEVVAVPVAVDVRLAEADARAPRDLAPESGGAPHVHDERRAVAVAEAAAAPVGIAQHEGAAPQAAQRPEGQALGDAGGGAHRFTVPLPGTNGGLRKKRAPLRRSRAACQWMRATTTAGITGCRHSADRSDRGVSSTRRATSVATKSGAPSSWTSIRTATWSPASENHQV